MIAGNDMGSGTAVDTVVRNCTLEARVIRTGLLTGSERLDALAAANLLVYPSRDEIFGLVPVEASMCGTPVVVCSDSGCGEVIAATGGGLTVPFADPQALAEPMHTILMHEDLSRRRARRSTPAPEVISSSEGAFSVSAAGSRRDSALRFLRPTSPS